MSNIENQNAEQLTSYILNTRENVSLEVAKKVADVLLSAGDMNIEDILAGKQEKELDAALGQQENLLENVEELMVKKAVEEVEKVKALEVIAGKITGEIEVPIVYRETKVFIKEKSEELEENCLNTNYVAEEVEFKVKKRPTKLSKKVIAMLLSILVAIGALKIAKEIKNYYENNKNNKQIEEMIAEIDQIYGVNIASIVSDNVREGTIASTGKETLGYNPSELAGDIIEVCKSNPNLFPVTLHKVFCDMPFSEIKLIHMDIIFYEIKLQTRDNENLSGIYNQIKDYTFLEYIVKSGYINKADENYEKLVSIAESFNQGRNYSDLSYEDKKIVDKALETYKFIQFSEDLTFEEPGVGGRK